MENERVRVIKVFRSAVLRIFCSPSYWFKLLSVMFLAAVSPYILEVFAQSAAMLPPQVTEAFRQGNGYNIGILVVPDLESNMLTRCDEILTGVISGSVVQCFAVFAVTGFIAKEFSCGYIKLAIMHGAKRSLIYAEYMGLSAVISLPLIILSPLCVYVSLAVKYHLTVEEPSVVLLTLVVQSVMLAAAAVCFAGISFSLNGKGGSVIGIGAILALPLIPNYIGIFTGGKVRIEGLLLVSRLVSSGENIVSHAAADLITAGITAAIFGFLGLVVFRFRNFD